MKVMTMSRASMLGRIGAACALATLAALSLGVATGRATTTAVHPTMPPGYAQVSGAAAATANSDAFAQATCPVDSAGVQTVPQGGGAYVASISTAASMNSSYPDTNG